MPRYSKLTTLIIDRASQLTLHGGIQITLNHIRQSYWIIGGRTPVRSFIYGCIRCAWFCGERAQQLMGQLPADRDTPSRSFSTTEVDYAGPLTLRSWKGRSAKQQKGWLCVFVSFVTPAIHLDVVSDCSADSFVAAFRRFTRRRGICTNLHSDCATTFVDADATLKALFTRGTEKANQLMCSLTSQGTTWKFNPLGVPHMGGKWEAAVKSVEFHLACMIGDAVLTYKELNTLFIQIGAIHNSRPLGPLSEDPENVEVLTSAHFLIGTSITTIPELSLMDIQLNPLDRWQFIQQRIQYIWAK